MTVFTPTFGFKGLMGQMHDRRTLFHDLSTAVVAGQIAGLIMAVVMMLVFGLFLGTSPLYPVQVIGSLFFGDSALVGLHLPALFTGLVLHQLGPSLFWALVFGICVHTFMIEGLGRQIALGLVIGVLSQAIDVYVLVPALFKVMQGDDLWAKEVPMMWSWAAHVVYGLCLGCYPLIDKALSRA